MKSMVHAAKHSAQICLHLCVDIQHIYKREWENRLRNEKRKSEIYILFLYFLPKSLKGHLSISVFNNGPVNNLANPRLNPERHRTNLITQRGVHRLPVSCPPFLHASEWGGIKMNEWCGLCYAKKRKTNRKCIGTKCFPVMNNKRNVDFWQRNNKNDMIPEQEIHKKND